MNAKALTTLEYPKILSLLQSYAASKSGKLKCQNLTPFTNLKDISRHQAETSTATGFILRKGSLPMGGIKNIQPSLTRASAGGSLKPEELIEISDSLYVFRKLTSYCHEEPENPLTPYFEGIFPCDLLEKEITRCIKTSGEVADNASANLSGIRRSIRTANDRIRDNLQNIIHSAAYKNMLQDAIITIRGERFCVPVKSEYKTSFPGMVHDQSSTGATVFMEPLSVVEQNNKIKDLHFEEKREEERILLKLSGLVAENAEILEAGLTQVTHLDFVFAKGELSLNMRATEPVFNDRGYIHIIKGRHPLLDHEKVVPTEIYLGGDFNMLLITGPNTGGKTVSLKTVGLLTIMGQSGLHIPAFDNSELAVFDEVFADIGDEQSIEQSLSTFSSHMTNIVNILANLTPKALVLLDELGAGTDPTEGAALATSILEYLRERQIRTIITTHYSELKLYALSTEKAENASCEFDVETLRPTYRLLIGIPGKSNAFAIARRLGLPDGIIETAKQSLTQKDIRFEDVITDLEASKKAVLQEQEKTAAYRREAEKLKQEISDQEEKLRTQKEKLMHQARNAAMEIVNQARHDSEKLLTEMQKKLENANQKELEESRKKIKEGLTDIQSELGVQPNFRTPPKDLRRGERVHIHSMNQSGTVSTPPDSSGEVQIQAGIMKIKVHISDLSREEEETLQKEVKKSKIGIKSPSIEVDLRGMLPEEATQAAEKFLDDALLSNLSTVQIIHGKGTGVLRTAVHVMLKRHPHVKEYRLGKYGEGEDGVTIVML